MEGASKTIRGIRSMLFALEMTESVYGSAGGPAAKAFMQNSSHASSRKGRQQRPAPARLRPLLLRLREVREALADADLATHPGTPF